MKYILAPYVRIGLDEKNMYMGFGSIQKVIVDKNFQKLLLAAAHYWINPKTDNEVTEYLLRECNAVPDEAQNSVNYLKNNNYLIDSEVYNREDRYSRHALYYGLSGADPASVQRKLYSKHVGILGCGGIGNQISCALATAGVGKITLIDFDIIEKSNLTRQIMFTESDIGMYKAEVLKRELLLRNSDIEVNTLHMKVDGQKFELPECDLAVVSADSPGIVDDFNRYALKKKTPYINVGYVQDVAAWGPFVLPGKTGCIACQKIVSTKRDDNNVDMWNLIKNINSRSQAPSIGAINMLAAAHATLDILRYLGEYGTIASLNKRMGIWTHNLTIETQDCTKNPNCPVCGDIK